MKILVSELWDGSRILEHSSHGPASHPEKKHITELLDQFKHEGPNSTHPCLVFEPLGPSAQAEAPCYKSNGLPGKIAWKTTQALAYIHANGIAHGI